MAWHDIVNCFFGLRLLKDRKCGMREAVMHVWWLLHGTADFSAHLIIMRGSRCVRVAFLWSSRSLLSSKNHHNLNSSYRRLRNYIDRSRSRAERGFRKREPRKQHAFEHECYARESAVEANEEKRVGVSWARHV